jgi:hypothetical protein
MQVHLTPHCLQRYDTLDDYYIGADGDLEFWISDTGNPISNRALLLHALVEQSIAESMGISPEQVDEWDMAHPDSEEPGEIEYCPYWKAHHIAFMIEKEFVFHSQVITWEQHEQNLERTLAQWKHAKEPNRILSESSETK